VYAYLQTASPEFEVEIDRIGYRQMLTNHLEVLVESYDLQSTSVVDTPDSAGYYTALKWYQNKWTTLIGYSEAASENNNPSKDLFTGVTYASDGYSITLEHHKVTRSSWIVEGPEFPEYWNSTVLAWRYKF